MYQVDGFNKHTENNYFKWLKNRVIWLQIISGIYNKDQKNCKEVVNYFSNHIISNGTGVGILILIYKEQLIILRSPGTNIFSIKEKNHKYKTKKS